MKTILRLVRRQQNLGRGLVLKHIAAACFPTKNCAASRHHPPRTSSHHIRALRAQVRADHSITHFFLCSLQPVTLLIRILGSYRCRLLVVHRISRKIMEMALNDPLKRRSSVKASRTPPPGWEQPPGRHPRLQNPLPRAALAVKLSETQLGVPLNWHCKASGRTSKNVYFDDMIL